MTIPAAYSILTASGQVPLVNPALSRRPVTVAVFVICLLVFLYIHMGQRPGAAGRGKGITDGTRRGSGRAGSGAGGSARSSLLKRAVTCGCYDRERILRGQWWRILTVGFTHIRGWHIAVNLYSLYAMSALEEMYGHAWFAAILLGSVAGGSLLELAVSKVRYSVGLSGGLYGLMFSWALLVWTYGGDIRSLLVTLLINLAINFAPGIAWQAHVGGALTGLVLTGIMLHV